MTTSHPASYNEVGIMKTCKFSLLSIMKTCKFSLLIPPPDRLLKNSPTRKARLGLSPLVSILASPDDGWSQDIIRPGTHFTKDWWDDNPQCILTWIIKIMTHQVRILHVSWQHRAKILWDLDHELFTHWGQAKWLPFRRQHFQTHFLEWKCYNFY